MKWAGDVATTHRSTLYSSAISWHLWHGCIGRQPDIDISIDRFHGSHHKFFKNNSVGDSPQPQFTDFVLFKLSCVRSGFAAESSTVTR